MIGLKFKQVNRTAGFEKELKKLVKRFRTLEQDLGIFINAQLIALHLLHEDNGGVKQITGLDKPFPPVFKAKKFACRSLKGKGAQTGIRVIYAYFAEEQRVDLLEVYFKGDQENEDRARLNTYLSRTE